MRVFVAHCLALLWLILSCSGAVPLELNLTSVGLSYSTPVTINGLSRDMVVDSGNMKFTVLDKTTNFTSMPNYYLDDQSCLFLLEDLSMVYYFGKNIAESEYGSGYMTCYEADQKVQMIGVSNVQVPNAKVTFSSTFEASNPVLHQWNNTGGNIGLAYSFYNSNSSVFESLVQNKTGNSTITGKNEIFGLDFNVDQNASSIQIGDVKPMYQNDMTWFRQGTNHPTYHEMLIKNLGVCDAAIDILQTTWKTTTNWPVLIDSGQICLTLPRELYDTTFSWLNISSPIASINDLPSLSFQIEDGEDSANSTTNLFHIPLSSLLVSPNYFNGESGSMNISVGGNTHGLCVLRGAQIFGSEKSGELAYPAPRIVFGSMVLRSLYFAGDFTSRSSGIASKVSSSQINSITNLCCKSKVQCIGQQKYEKSSNSCKSPQCTKYFFAELDHESQQCIYRYDMYVSGLFIISCCIFFEIISYFIIQYSALEMMGLGEESRFQFTRPMNTNVDIFSKKLGQLISYLTDWIIILYKKHD